LFLFKKANKNGPGPFGAGPDWTDCLDLIITFTILDFWAAPYEMIKMPLSVTCAMDTPKHPTNYNIRDLSSGHYFSKLLIFPTSVT
jgi:hypothetical protein